MLRLQPRGQVRDPDRGDVPVGARPHHGGPPQRHEPLLPTPGVPITTVGSLQHSKPPEKILTAIAKVSHCIRQITSEKRLKVAI